MFVTLMEACLQTVVELLEKQYDKYFKCNLTEELAAETKSARTHNIDAEEIMGMFSALKAKSPNVFICYISCKMRAKKNGTVKYLEAMDKVNRGDFEESCKVRAKTEKEEEGPAGRCQTRINEKGHCKTAEEGFSRKKEGGKKAEKDRTKN